MNNNSDNAPSPGQIGADIDSILKAMDEKYFNAKNPHDAGERLVLRDLIAVLYGREPRNYTEGYFTKEIELIKNAINPGLKNDTAQALMKIHELRQKIDQDFKNLEKEIIQGAE